MRLLFPVVDNTVPSGGRKFIYDVVDFLNSAGIEAWVVHPYKDFRLTWFNNQTQVGYCIDLFPNKKSIPFIRKLNLLWKGEKNTRAKINVELIPTPLKIHENDILVLPETRLPIMHRLPKTCRKVIFNQGPYLTFGQMFSSVNEPNPQYFGADVLGMMVVSELNMNYQKYIFPQTKIVQGRLFVDEDFCYQDAKKKQIAYMPRRGEMDALAVLNILKFRGIDKEVSIVPIDGMSQQEVARIMSESLIFLSFADREGFGLPAAEAMACGCIVIGYSGNGGDEFFDQEYCYPIQSGDLLSYVETIEMVLQENRTNAQAVNIKRKLASESIRQQYSKEKSKQSIKAAFQQLLEND